MSMSELEKSMDEGVDVLGPGPIIVTPMDAETKFGEPLPKDPWMHRSEGMLCKTCMFYVPKNASVIGPNKRIGRCRRHAPTMSGYPVVYHDDWCGDHKLDENKS